MLSQVGPLSSNLSTDTMPPPTVLVIRKEKTENRKNILCMNTNVMDATSVMDPDPHGSALILFGFLLLDVLI